MSKLIPGIPWRMVINALQQVAGIRIVIGGSAQLQKLGLRTMEDVDAFVHLADWDKLLDSKMGIVGVAEPTLDLVYRIDASDLKIEIFKTSHPRGFSYTDWNLYDVFDPTLNIRCWSLVETIKWKNQMGREKDMADLRLIDRHLYGGIVQ